MGEPCCGNYDCLSPRLTPEAQAVLDALGNVNEEWLNPELWARGSPSRKLAETYRAYRASLRPAPRYYSRGRLVFQHPPGSKFEEQFASALDETDAEKIAAALNAAESR